MIETQVLVIGAGPGGYVAAIKLGKLGQKTLLVDRDALGGECLNYGCIPSKALISAANVAHKLRKAKDIGIESSGVSVDMEKVQKWRAGLVEGFRKGVSMLTKGNGAEVLMGEAGFTGPREALVRGKEGTETVRFERALIATGSRPMEIPGFAIDRANVLGNKEALELPSVPARLLVIGGGVVGLEIGTYYAKLGSKVTVVEMLPQILAGIDPDLTQPVSRSLAKLGIDVLLSSKASSYKALPEGLEAVVQTQEGEKRLMADKILLSVGRAPNTDSLNLEAAGVRKDGRGYVPVNASYQTSVPHIYAIGDVVGPPFLAHKASREAALAAEAISGKEPGPLGAVPWAIFTDPEIASVGITESQAREKGIETVQGRFPFSASGRAQASREPEGFVKVLAEKGTERILGVGIVGANASDMISEACLAVRLNATLEDVASTIHPHPTLPEAFQEACEAAQGRAVHILAPVRR